MSPIASGIYQGITLFQSRTSTAPITVTGNGNLTITGTVYAPLAPLFITGNGGTDQQGSPLDIFGSLLIADDMTITGNGSIRAG